jgi:cation:H+ antiporter
MFNLLAVIGIAGAIAPMPALDAQVLYRDWPVMMGMMLLLALTAYGFRGEGRITRLEGLVLLLSYAAYNAYLVISVTGAAALP